MMGRSSTHRTPASQGGLPRPSRRGARPSDAPRRSTSTRRAPAAFRVSRACTSVVLWTDVGFGVAAHDSP